MAYRARGFGENPLYKILSDHWRTFLGAYEERFQHTGGALRSVTGRVVERFLDCGNPMNGFARIKCSDCGAERLLHFSCKTRGFCPSCQARRSEEWSRWFAETLSAPVPHHQIVFTIPKMLRAYFRYDRTLMSDLSRAAYRAVAQFVEASAGPGVRPAMVVVKHTFGEGVRFHPHLHALATAGGWDGDQTWSPLPAWDPRAIRNLFEIEVFRFLRRKGLLSRERMELIRSWPHSGFNVHVSKAIPAGETISLALVARYILRAPLMLSRISYDRDRVTVRVDPHGSRAREATELDVLDFIARLTAQIPGPHERIVHYYGPYANASRLRSVTKATSQAPDCPTDCSDEADQGEYIKKRRVRWARLIRMVWLEDPLLYPRCGGAMRIISFITDSAVIDKILRTSGSHTPPRLRRRIVRRPGSASPHSGECSD
jgi:ribosomal protein S27E